MRVLLHRPYGFFSVGSTFADGMNTHRYNVQTVHSIDGMNTRRYNVQTIHGSSLRPTAFDFRLSTFDF